MTKTITKLEEKRCTPAAEIRLAKRAVAKAQQVQLLYARQSLGVRLSGAVGAGTCEAVEARSKGLTCDKVLAYLRQRIAREALHFPLPNSDANASESGQGCSDQP